MEGGRQAASQDTHAHSDDNFSWDVDITEDHLDQVDVHTKFLQSHSETVVGKARWEPYRRIAHMCSHLLWCMLMMAASQQLTGTDLILFFNMKRGRDVPDRHETKGHASHYGGVDQIQVKSNTTPNSSTILHWLLKHLPKQATEVKLVDHNVGWMYRYSKVSLLSCRYFFSRCPLNLATPSVLPWLKEKDTVGQGHG